MQGCYATLFSNMDWLPHLHSTGFTCMLNRDWLMAKALITDGTILHIGPT